MFILIFFIILSLLVFVHELGHFLFAKMAGVRVEEFGFGYPPRLYKMGHFRGTDITLNWIPFGGFVKILGENPGETTVNNSQSTINEKTFTQVNKLWQIAILVAGVLFNFIFAGILFSVMFMVGAPYPASGELGGQIINKQVMVTSVLPASPAFEAGLKAGDVIQDVSRGSMHAQALNTKTISDFIATSPGKLNIQIKRGKTDLVFDLTPQILPGQDEKLLVGIGMEEVGLLKLPFWASIKQGSSMAWEILGETFKGFGSLIAGLFKGKSNLADVAGPVGIVSLVGEAYKLGLVYLLSFTALISINLAVINLVPFPALDGGRILMVIVEKIKGSPVSPRIFNGINTVGFALLILLMIVVTIHDIVRLF